MPTIHLRRLELPIHLGWPDDERAATQVVWVDLEIRFTEAPAAVRTDELSDSLDYGLLAEALRSVAAARPYRLLEHFSAVALAAVRERVSPAIGLRLVVTKFPSIEGLAGGVSFTLDDPPVP
jgi:7,8-dihydroneopterin aldolase/epimerase/oxygenase